MNFSNVKAVVQYDGTAYCGFQRQPHLPTIQAELEKALRTLLRIDTPIQFAGRTDSGVHALHQVINFPSAEKLDHYVFRHKLNSILPNDVRVSKTLDVQTEFNSRSSALLREYVYVIMNRRYSSPFMGRYCWHVPETLELTAMQAGAKLIEGEHDFSAFAAQSGITRSNVREVFAATLMGDGDYITFTIRATAYLHHMVRNIIGTLVEIGAGQREPDNITDLLRSCDRALSGITAPAKGLFLAHVEYDQEER